MDPNIKAVVSSGYATDSVISEFEKFGFIGQISKPYLLEDMKKIIANSLQ